MRLPARTPVYAARLLAGLVPLSALLFATVNGKQPFSGPTVPPPLPERGSYLHGMGQKVT